MRRRRLRSPKMRGRIPQGKSYARRGLLKPWLILGGIVLAIAAIVCLIIFVIVPLFRGTDPLKGQEEAAPSATIAPVVSEAPKLLGYEDMLDLAVDIDTGYKSINTPMICGSEMIFTSGDKDTLNPSLKNVVIYDMETGVSTVVDGITCANDELLYCQFNENWIVYADTISEGGGSICAYNRQTGESFVVRKYFYGVPRIGLSDNYLAFSCQTNVSTDKRYLTDLSTSETVTMRVLANQPTAVSGVAAGGGEIVWVEPSNSEAVTGLFNCEILRMKLETGAETLKYDPGSYVYYPVTNGTDIAWLDAPRTEDAKLYVSVDGGSPQLIAAGVLNYDIGADFVAYTLENKVYVYFYEDGSQGCISGLQYQAVLESADGNAVVWCDITDGVNERDILRYARVGATAPEQKDAVPTVSAGTPTDGGATGE